MKFISRFVFFLFVLFFIFSCSTAYNEITISHHFLHQQAELLESAIRDFEVLYPKIKIKANYQNFQDLETTWNSRTYQELKKSAELMIIPHDRIGSLAEWKVLRPIDDILAPHTEEFYPKAIEAVTYLDHNYGVPISMETLLLFYRKDRVTEIPRTISDLLIQTDRFTGRDRVVFPSHIPYFALPWIFAYGGSLYSPIGTIQMDQEGNAKAIQKYRDFLKMVGTSIQTEKKAYQSFVSGVAPFFISGQWSVESLIADGVPFGVTTLPDITKGHPVRPFIGVQCIAVNKTVTKKQYKEIKLFLNFLMEKKFSNDLSIASKYLSPLKQDLNNYQDPILLAGRKQLENAILMNNYPDMVKIWKSLSPQVLERLLKSKNPQFLLKTLQKEIITPM